MALWSKLIPELLSTNGKVMVSIGNEEEDDREMGNVEGGFRSILPLPTLSAINTKSRTSPTTESSPHEPDSSHNPTLMGAQPEVDQHSDTFHLFPIPGSSSESKGVFNGSSSSGDVVHSGGIALSIVIVIGICFLVLNVCACAGVFYQRDRVRFKEMLLQRQYKLRPANQDGTVANPNVDPDADPTTLASHRVNDDDMEGGSGLEGLHSGLPHQVSTSTMDPHTKVSRWIAQEISVERCPTPTQQHRNRLTKPIGTEKLGGSDRYDPRDCAIENGTCILFPQLTKSSKASDIYGLVPVKEENNVDQREHLKVAQSSDVAVQENVVGVTASVASSSVPFADSTSSVPTASRSSTGRRKLRSKSQLSVHQRSITKRDVAVGGDDDDEQDFGQDERRSSAYGYGTMDTIRRLNLPKVLPDLPHQDIETLATSSATRTNSSSTSDPSSPIYTTPYAAALASSSASRQSVIESPLSTNSFTSHPTIVKTNLPQTLVLAPRPRATGSSTKPSTASPHYKATEPEPCLVIRPGPRQLYHPTVDSTTNRQSISSTTGDAVLRRPNQQDASTGPSRPSNRNSRSWYAQYSQSFISQSVDQDSDDNQT